MFAEFGPFHISYVACDQPFWRWYPVGMIKKCSIPVSVTILFSIDGLAEFAFHTYQWFMELFCIINQSSFACHFSSWSVQRSYFIYVIEFAHSYNQQTRFGMVVTSFQSTWCSIEWPIPISLWKSIHFYWNWFWPHIITLIFCFIFWSFGPSRSQVPCTRRSTCWVLIEIE